jgi:hypothetical protein
MPFLHINAMTIRKKRFVAKFEYLIYLYCVIGYLTTPITNLFRKLFFIQDKFQGTKYQICNFFIILLQIQQQTTVLLDNAASF